MMFRLENKTALVTGAGSGIGAAIAQRFAAQGAKVAALDVQAAVAEQVAATIRAAGGEPLAVTVAIADEARVAAAFATVVAQ